VSLLLAKAREGVGYYSFTDDLHPYVSVSTGAAKSTPIEE
jgi:hypothetical protein